MGIFTSLFVGLPQAGSGFLRLRHAQLPVRRTHYLRTGKVSKPRAADDWAGASITWGSSPGNGSSGSSAGNGSSGSSVTTAKLILFCPFFLLAIATPLAVTNSCTSPGVSAGASSRARYQCNLTLSCHRARCGYLELFALISLFSSIPFRTCFSAAPLSDCVLGFLRL